MNSKILIPAVLMALITTGGVWYLVSQPKPSPLPLPPITTQTGNSHAKCFSENETADYKEDHTDTEAHSVVSITDKTSQKEVFSFTIPNVAYQSFANHQFKACHVYVEKEFGYDYKNNVGTKEYHREVWRYDYSGKGEKIADFSDFRIDDTETYIAYQYSTVDRPDYAFQIMNIKTGKLEFSISMQELVDKYHVEPGAIHLMDCGLKKFNEENLFMFDLINNDSSTFGLDISTKQLNLAGYSNP